MKDKTTFQDIKIPLRKHQKVARLKLKDNAII